MKQDKNVSEVFDNVIDIWVVYQGDDDRQSGSPAWFFTSQSVAISRAKGTGWYGGNAHVEKRQAVCINGKHYLIDKIAEIDIDGKVEEARLKLRKKAKAKLSQEELEALGVVEEET